MLAQRGSARGLVQGPAPKAAAQRAQESPRSLGLKQATKGAGAMRCGGVLECGWASATLLPNVILIARRYITRAGEAAAGHRRADDNVLFAKLNDFYLGGGVHLFGHLNSCLTGQKRDARYSSQPKKTTSLLKLYVKLRDCTNPIPIDECCLFTAQRLSQVCAAWLDNHF